MRVLYITNGQSPHDLRFTTALAQTEHEIFVLCLDGISAGWPSKVNSIQWEPVRKSWLGIRLQTPKLRSEIESIKPNIVHAGPVQGPAFLAALTGFHPLVTMSWGSDVLLDAGRNFETKRITRFTLSHTDVLVGDSGYVEEKARGFGYRGPYFQFPWGVDLKHFTPAGSTQLRAKLGWQNNTVLLSMRSFEKLYDVECIARSFVQACKKRPDLRLLLFGRGSQEKSLRQIIDEGGAMDKVHFGGQVDLNLLPDIYRSADLYISASHSDGTSVSLMEALACGLPVVVSDIPGNREWVLPGTNGWFFPTGNVEDLARTMVQFECTSPEVLLMKKNNRDLAELRGDWTKNFPVLMHAYEQALTIRKGNS